MPKVRDLTVSAIPAESDLDTRRFWMGNVWVFPPPKPKEPECKPSPPPKPKPKDAAGIPHDEVIRMKQQLQQRIKSHAYV